MGQHWDVIVVAGGLAGLAAGVTATAGGARTLVLEAGAVGVGHAPCRERLSFSTSGPTPSIWGCRIEGLSELGVRLAGPTPLARYRRASVGTPCAAEGPATLLRTRCSEPGARPSSPAPRPPAAHRCLEAHAISMRSGRRPRPPDDVRAVVASLVRLRPTDGELEGCRPGPLLTASNGVGGRGALCGWGFSSIVAALAGKTHVRRGPAVLAGRPGLDCVELETGGARWPAGRVILAPGDPAATLALLPDGAGWGDLGGPVTAACLDVGVDMVPTPVYVLGIDEPLYATTPNPRRPARAPDGAAVVAVLRYGASDRRQGGARGLPSACRRGGRSTSSSGDSCPE